MDNFKKNFENDKNFDAIRANNTVFDSYNQKFFNQRQLEEDPKYFESINDSFLFFSEMSVKCYREVKELSLEALQLMDRLGKVFFEISSLFDSHIESAKKLDIKLNSTLHEAVVEQEKQQQKALAAVGGFFKAQKELFKLQVAQFRIKKRDYKEIAVRLNQIIQNRATSISAVNELNVRKQKLFDSKKTENWKLEKDKIPGELDTIIKTFALVKEYMLPSVGS